MVSSEDDEKPICPHKSCILACIRGSRNGFYYASRLRFAHAFVMSFLFGSGDVKDRLMSPVNHRFTKLEMIEILKEQNFSSVEVVKKASGLYIFAIK